MAINLAHRLSITLGSTVNDAITAVRAVRVSEQSKKEAAFQAAIADGTMTYAAQLKFRQAQLDDEKTSPLSDPDYMAQLETSIGSIKKLGRYQQVRDKYKEALNSYADGKSSINNVIGILTDALSTETDETLRTELNSQLTNALDQKTTLEKQAIQNRITIATTDKSVPLLNDSIKEVSGKKSEALLAGDDETATMWDATLHSLNAQKSTIQVDSAVNDMNYQIMKGGMTSGKKLSLLTGQVNDADTSSPFVYNGTRYASMKDYWQQQTASYISTNYFTDVKAELDAETSKVAALSAFGQVPVERITAVNDFYKSLTARPEFAPYINQIEQERVSTVSSLATELQSALTDEANDAIQRGQDVSAVETKTNTTLDKLETTTGIKLARLPSTAAIKSGQTLAADVNSTPDPSKAGILPTLPTTPPVVKPGQAEPPAYDAMSGRLTDYGRSKGLTEINHGAAPVTPATPVAPVAPVVAPVVQPAIAQPAAAAPATSYAVQKGDTLGALAVKHGLTVAQLQALNPDITDPNKIKIGQAIKLN